MARREFLEETGFAVDGDFLEVGTIKQAGGKVVTAWAVEGEFDAALLRSNVFEMEWPPGLDGCRSFRRWIGVGGFRLRRLGGGF